MVVAQRVVDELQLAAGGRHDRDVVPTLGSDLLAERAQDGVTGQPLNGLDHGPADQGAALFICGGGDVQALPAVGYALLLDHLRRGRRIISGAERIRFSPEVSRPW